MSNHHPQISKELVHCELLQEDRLHEVRCAECGRCGMADKIWQSDLEAFTAAVIGHYGAPESEAETVARNLVRADLRGINSHGVARLGRYISGIKAGYIRPGVTMEVLEPSATIGVMDAKNGLGQVAAERAMGLAIEKAKGHGLGVVTVKNSNHYGIAGYYVQMAMEQGLLGLSMTNAGPLVIPTHGAQALLGTNPISLGVPTGRGLPVLIDLATSVVPRGKLEVYDRNQQQMPVGWSVDEQGYDCQNPGQVLKNLVERAGGGILPLGGRGEEFGGHKGFSLALMVDLLCGVLSGSAFGTDVHNLTREVPEGEIAAPRVGHFFLALDLERFAPREIFEERLEAFVTMIKESRKALDQNTIYIPGEKEQLRTQAHQASGIPLSKTVYDALRKIAAECDLAPPPSVAECAREGFEATRE